MQDKTMTLFCLAALEEILSVGYIIKLVFALLELRLLLPVLQIDPLRL